MAVRVNQTDTDLLAECVKPYLVSKLPLPMLFIVPKNKWRKLYGCNSAGRTIGALNDKGQVIPYALIPQGASTRVKLHELGHVTDQESTWDAGDIRDTIRSEIEARAFAKEAMRGELTERDLLAVINYVAEIHPEITPKSVFRKVKRAVQKRGAWWNITMPEFEAMLIRH